MRKHLRWIRACSIVILLLHMLMLCSCSVSFPSKKPTQGVWYCAELQISIDFGLLAAENTPYCAVLHNGEGEDIPILCLIDYGRTMCLTSLDQKTEYYIARFAYKDNVLETERISDGKMFYFYQVHQA